MLLKDKKVNLTSGILLPLSSLPSNYGIGSLGKEAYRFGEFLSKTNQTYWQLLPLCPFGKGNSPYSSSSSFAGEILYIDLDFLAAEGLLLYDDLPKNEFSKNVDYKTVRKIKLPLLRQAADNFDIDTKNFKAFLKEHSFWLDDYCLYMALKDFFKGKPFYLWDDKYKYRFPDALEEFSQNHYDEILFYKITQYFFFCQFNAFKNYMNVLDIKLIGDIPFYVSPDSADVWANPSCFKLGRDLKPTLVAGVPPDVFSKDGQLWGNPIYDWEYQKKTDFTWWKSRLFHNCRMYDTLRIDHFRAFADYYSISSGCTDAKSGKWEKGIGMYFWNSVKPVIKNTEIIAEDLGGETPIVEKLIKDSGFPNMKVLQFAFDSDLSDPFLPKNYNSNCICYTGTHDNDTTVGWYHNATQRERLIFNKLVPLDKSGSIALSLISYGMKSKAKTVIIPFPDYLELDSEGRINTPGKENGNWEWRFEKEALTEELERKVLRLSEKRNNIR